MKQDTKKDLNASKSPLIKKSTRVYNNQREKSNEG